MSASRFLGHIRADVLVSVRQDTGRDKTRPRLPAPGYPARVQRELDRLVARLRHLSPAEWPVRRGAVLTALSELAALGDALEPHQVPALPDHALADALAVIGGDALDAAQRSADPQRRAAVDEALRRLLEETA